MPNIVAFRVDERLIHGQGQVWIKALGMKGMFGCNNKNPKERQCQRMFKLPHSCTHLTR